MSPVISAHVDVARLDANIRRLHDAAAAAGVAVRAHVKGHRTPRIAGRQVRAGAGGIAVTRVGEARHYAGAGFEDIVVAWPWRDRERLTALARVAGSCRLSLHVDDVDTVAELGRAARAHGAVIGVRAVVEPGVDTAGIARRAACTAGLRLGGVSGYADLTGPEEARDRDRIGRTAAARTVSAAEALRAEGLECPVVAVGGTPAARAVMTVAGVTEIGAGAYALCDAGLARLGVCRFEDVAVGIDVPAAAAAELTEGLHQPWSPETATFPDGRAFPGEAPSAASPHPGGLLRLLPAHVCPLVLRLEELHTSDGERWPTVRGEA
ncbi:hypothetical protein Pve01_46820 [Planomonospora venezuelensis]|nr:hypothetical protein Pve01_46820 [Planomonospora venezuelensis]